MFRASTYVVVNFPTPFGWMPLEWYSDGGGSFTMAMIVVGAVVSLVLVATSLEAWWKSLGVLLLVNFFFGFFTFVAVAGCRREGCEFAQTFEVAYPWHLAVTELTLVAFVLTALYRLRRY